MVVAGQNVLDAKPDEAGQSDWARGAEIDGDPRRFRAEQVLAAARGRADRRDRDIMRAEQIGPILLELQPARRGRTMQVVLDERFESGADIPDGDTSGPARRPVN